VLEPTAADERRHAAGADASWQESWDLEFFSAEGDLGGYARLTLPAAGSRAWFVAALVGVDRRPVSVVDHDVVPPRRDELEVRSSGLWVDLQCLVPGDHVTLGLECFGVQLDDPADALLDGRGAVVPLGFDLEWDTASPARPALDAGRGTGYDLACRVHGEVLVAEERHQLDGWGRRAHTWGPVRARDWPATVAGRRRDGAWVHGSEPEAAVAPGAVCWAPVPVPDGDEITAVWRGLGALVTPDGVTGHGWFTRTVPEGVR
jgi:hypothetical protein